MAAKPLRSGQVTVRAIRHDGSMGRFYVIEADARSWGWGGRSRREQLIAWDVNHPQKIRAVRTLLVFNMIESSPWLEHGKLLSLAGGFQNVYTITVGKVPGSRGGRPVFFLGPNAKRIYEAFFREET